MDTKVLRAGRYLLLARKEMRGSCNRLMRGDGSLGKFNIEWNEGSIGSGSVVVKSVAEQVVVPMGRALSLGGGSDIGKVEQMDKKISLGEGR